jgi:hypothetical protein
MFDQILQSESFRRVVADNPCGASEYSAVRVLLKKIIWAFQCALEKTGVRIDWDSENEKGRRPKHIVIYDVENDETTIVPVKLTKVLVRLGPRVVFVGHERGTLLLGRALLDEIEKTQNSALMT